VHPNAREADNDERYEVDEALAILRAWGAIREPCC
jgi:hypothetical protein